jgi:DNA-binding transcriptional MocR family regulator
MSWVAIDRVFKNSKSRGSARQVLVAIAYRANQYGNCWPSINTIVDDSGLSRSTVWRALEELKEMGEIGVSPRYREGNSSGIPHRTSSLYQIILDA